jgi:hypothetical protein
MYVAVSHRVNDLKKPALQEALRNIHGLFQPKMPQKAHEYCAFMF